MNYASLLLPLFDGCDAISPRMKKTPAHQVMRATSRGLDGHRSLAETPQFTKALHLVLVGLAHGHDVRGDVVLLQQLAHLHQRFRLRNGPHTEGKQNGT